MIKIKDLKKGNFVMYSISPSSNIGLFFEVKEIHEKTIDVYSGIEREEFTGWHIEEIIPIPISEEWLLRLGFIKQEDEKFIHTEPNFPYPVKNHTNNQWEVWIDGGREWETLSEINYIHDLQNIYHTITGKQLQLPISTK